MLLKNDILPSIRKPTRVTRTSHSIIDNIFSNNIINYGFESGIIKSDRSDHFLKRDSQESRRIDRLENKVTKLSEENISIKKELAEMKHSLQFHSDLVEQQLETNNKKDDEALKFSDIIQEKVAELEDRSRRNNLRFSGIEEDGENESWEQSEQKVRTLLNDKLGIEEVNIERAHRSGNSKNGENTKRTIIVKLLNYKEKQCILDAFHKNKLWTQRIYINEDFSGPTLAKRRELFKEVKELRDKGIKAKVVYNKIVYLNNVYNSVQSSQRDGFTK